MVKDFMYDSPYIYCPACGISIPKDEVNTQHIYKFRKNRDRI